jgi:U3 small nucleolar RNA-associated protein 12
MALRPDGKAFMTGSADKDVKFWELYSAGGKVGFKLTRQLQMTHDVLCVRYSSTTKADKLLLAVGLLDNTIKIFHDDSVKFFLSLYGHKAPVMCIDMSYDNTILVSGSADKTIKIWGMDFGDCHRSLIAHEDSVTCLKFQPKTHYFFSCGKDGVVKYWDADRFEQILKLPGHTSGVWSLDVSPDASYVASVSQDRSLRLWERNTGDMVFVEEEKELAMEAMVTSSIEKQQKDADAQLVLSGEGGTVAAADVDAGAVLATHIDVVKGGEKLMESIDLVEKELAEMREQTLGGAAYAVNPLMMGMAPFPYLVHILRTAIKSSELESALLILPFHYVVRFVPMLTEICRLQLDIELSTKCVVFLLRCHMPRIVSTQAIYTDMLALKAVLKSSICGYRDVVGTNIAALSFLTNKVGEQTDFAASMADINQGKGSSKDEKKQKKQRIA